MIIKSVALGEEEPNGNRTWILELMDNWRGIGGVLRVLKSFVKEGFIPAVEMKGNEGDVFESLPMFAEREPRGFERQCVRNVLVWCALFDIFTIQFGVG